jgi:CrcB protein
MLPWFLVAFGGAIGAVMRYSIGRFSSYLGLSAPVSTFAVNFTGSYLLAIVLFTSERNDWLDDRWKVFLTVGMLGAFTTMSTFSFDRCNFWRMRALCRL